ncbi:MAG TPA: lipocalin-like domain-containing protein [Vicinamibacterales bacterium]|nr:lipocalin-like domain-containing protein [Vicinamibacterales bacterium]
MRERLIGSWRLVSYETKDAAGRTGRPYGNAVGRISYDANGNMTGQVMRPDRPAVEPGTEHAHQARTAFLGYIAYFGTYDVAPDGRSVVHHVQGALNPAWVGGDQVRQMRFDGDRLILSTVTRKDGAALIHELTWERC